jgi:hypothetical protein
MTNMGHPMDWEIVWEQSGAESEIDADLVVSLLEGSDIPVVRIPPSNAPVVFDGFGGPMLPVRVLVPPDHASDARDLIEGADIGIETEELIPDE